jgi:NAD-dependent SIR2 family protein deacetylase
LATTKITIFGATMHHLAFLVESAYFMTSDSEQKKSKTVYFLGAGFSMDAGLPSQDKVLEKVLKNQEAKKKLKQFIDAFAIQKETRLEDIFTLLDRCIHEQRTLKGFSYEELITFRNEFIDQIADTALTVDDKKKLDYIKTFSKYIVNKCEGAKYGKKSGEREDPISVISTNWDTLLDEAIYKIIAETKAEKDLIFDTNRAKFKGTLDFGNFISSIDKKNQGEHIIPGLEMLALGGYNVKLLKLHGSKNWLQCSSCDRIYAVNLSGEFNHNPTKNLKCKHCKRNLGFDSTLEKQLIMPTYLKDLKNIQYKLIWQNAAIEIAEATKIVFIGYSLPEADYEIRQLLMRNIARNTQIEVVGYLGPDDPEKNNEKENIQDKWRNFLSVPKENIEFYYDGAEKYIYELCPSTQNSEAQSDKLTCM